MIYGVKDFRRQTGFHILIFKTENEIIDCDYWSYTSTVPEAFVGNPGISRKSSNNFRVYAFKSDSDRERFINEFQVIQLSSLNEMLMVVKLEE